MNPEILSIGILFMVATVAVMLSIEAGYRMGRFSHRRSEDEKESPVSAIAGSVLGLVAFMLAFTFGIVAQRYDTKKSLVREEANTIRTAWMRSDFLPEPDRSEAGQLLRQYVNSRLEGVSMIQNRKVTLDHMEKLLAEADRIQRRLWEMAVVNARKDMNSDVAALYVDSLNQLIEIHVSRVTIGMQQRIPAVIWIVLAGLTFCGMLLVGYQTGIAGSNRSSARPFLAISFSMVVALIASLDRPGSFLTVSQRPLMDLRESMDRASSGVDPSH
jgi:hypothetical protein